MNVSANTNAMSAQFTKMDHLAKEVAQKPTEVIPAMSVVSADFKANVSVQKTQDDMYGSLLDIKA